MVFDLIEVFIGGLIHNPVMVEVLNELNNRVSAVWFGSALVIFVSFLPFFTLKEVSRVIGSKKFRGMLLRNRIARKIEL
jgi:lauroyl/myristoyl acyltransferase